MTGWMVVSDPPDHRRLRALAANAFSPKRVKAMEDEIQRLVDQTLDEFIASGEEDLIAGLQLSAPGDGDREADRRPRGGHLAVPRLVARARSRRVRRRRR